MNILFAASEAAPFIKSGGLADVAGALPAALCAQGHDCRVVLPLYRDIPERWRREMTYLVDLSVPLSWRCQRCGVYTLRINKVTYYFLDNGYCFDRCGSYGFFDDGERFALFSRAVIEMLLRLNDFTPAIIHCNDWQTALIPVFLHAFYAHEPRLRGAKTVLTIHNIQYQGAYGMEVAEDILGLPPQMVEIVEYGGEVNYLKGGMERCHALTTVSPTYAQEILEPVYSCGLDGFLRQRRGKISGILNGIDCAEYDPAADRCLPCHYTADDLTGKAENKRELRQQLGLESNDTMLIGIASRLVGHKGLDLVCSAMERLMQEPVQLAVLGCGESGYEQFFREAAMRWPGRVSVTLGFDESLARRIYAGADVFLMPSRSEPCGLAQMLALRYGTPPIVRLTGGLRDTVRDFGGENGNGYTFLTCTAEDMLDAVRRALKDYADTNIWKSHIVAAMCCEHGWSCSAAEYIQLYQKLM